MGQSLLRDRLTPFKRVVQSKRKVNSSGGRKVSGGKKGNLFFFWRFFFFWRVDFSYKKKIRTYYRKGMRLIFLNRVEDSFFGRFSFKKSFSFLFFFSLKKKREI